MLLVPRCLVPFTRRNKRTFRFRRHINTFNFAALRDGRDRELTGECWSAMGQNLTRGCLSFDPLVNSTDQPSANMMFGKTSSLSESCLDFGVERIRTLGEYSHERSLYLSNLDGGEISPVQNCQQVPHRSTPHGVHNIEEQNVLGSNLTR